VDGAIVASVGPYRPLSKREVSDPDLDMLHEGVTPWMVEPLARWLETFFVHHADYDTSLNLDFIEGFEMTKRLSRPMSRDMIMRDVVRRLQEDETFGLDAVDYALHSIGDGFYVRERIVTLAQLLLQSGSAWMVSSTGDDENIRWKLARRNLAAAKAALSDIRSQDERTGGFLADAWRALAIRDPQPSEGYGKAVMAIEAAAQPIVTPDDQAATLGKMISAMRDKPEKWTFALGDLDLIIDMADRLWTNHFRHGTQPRNDHTLEEADAALHLAIPLVRFFVGGLIRRTET
jgi:hypothetical protein